MQFTSFEAFARHLATLAEQQDRALKKGLVVAVRAIEKTAKSEIGYYQPATGPFSAWRKLAPSTQADRVAKGFAPNKPLLRTGKLKDSISYQVAGLHAAVGSTSDVMVAQELGTSRIPARAVLGPAALRSIPAVKAAIGHAAMQGILPAGYAGAANYRFTV